MKRNGGSGVVVVSAGGRPLSRVCVVVLVVLINWKIHSKVPFVRFEGKKELASCVCVCVCFYIYSLLFPIPTFSTSTQM